jgi:diaminohydroxyphosphoribosylaminopyrimidine deaminase/5-amino-6-(5-phosphoribosylamino)uracil reductase
MNDADTMYMRRAIMLARRGWGQTAPNPMVGAIIVREGRIVGEGFHPRYGEEHAEVAAIEAAAERARGATLYVTLEPCTHQGKRPPCAPAVVASGIRRVVIATRDPNPAAAGGATVLREAGIEVEIGVEEAEARELNAAFLHRFTSDRPFTSLKLAVSIDGAIADASRSRGWLTGQASRAEVHRQRAGFGAISAGIGTVLTDDPLLTVRGGETPRVVPTRVIFDRGARLPLGSRIMQSVAQAPVLVVTDGSARDREQALERAGARILHATGTTEAMRALKQEGIESVYVEGGAGLAGALLEAGLVDRLIIFRSPVVLGANALGAFDGVPSHSLAEAPRWRVVRRERFGDDDMTIYALP